MCYSNSSTSTNEQLAARYTKKFSEISDIPIYFANGFNLPTFRIITKEPFIKESQWGLVPNWFIGDSKEIVTKTLNARVESISEKKSFRYLIHRKHCIIPSTGFYEWHTIGKEKIPYFIRPKNEKLFSMIGLFDENLDKQTGVITHSFTIITTMANKLMSNIHNIKKRMPLIIARELEEEWLNGESERILGFSFPSSGMIAYPVKKSNILNAINSPETQNIFEQNISSQSTLF